MAGEVTGPSHTSNIFLNKHRTQLPSSFVSIPIIDYTGLELIRETLCSGCLMETLTPGQHSEKECLWGAPHRMGHLYHPPPPHYLENIMEAGRVETAGARDCGGLEHLSVCRPWKDFRTHAPSSCVAWRRPAQEQARKCSSLEHGRVHKAPCLFLSVEELDSDDCYRRVSFLKGCGSRQDSVLQWISPNQYIHRHH